MAAQLTGHSGARTAKRNNTSTKATLGNPRGYSTFYTSVGRAGDRRPRILRQDARTRWQASEGCTNKRKTTKQQHPVSLSSSLPQ